MSTERENRTCRVTVRLTDEEEKVITEKMKKAGISKMAVFFRKMVLDGFVLKLDIPEIKEMISLLRYSSNNLNQIARRANETGRIYSDDLAEIRMNQGDPFRQIRKVFLRFGDCFGILVKGIQMAGCQFFRQSPGMTAAAQRRIHIDALRLNVQQFNRLRQQYALVLHYFRNSVSVSASASKVSSLVSS